MATAIASPEITYGRVRKMGKVVTRIVVTNRIDQALAERGVIPASAIRRVTLDGVLVDTDSAVLLRHRAQNLPPRSMRPTRRGAAGQTYEPQSE